MQAGGSMFWLCVRCCKGTACLLYFQNPLSAAEEKWVMLIWRPLIAPFLISWKPWPMAVSSFLWSSTEEMAGCIFHLKASRHCWAAVWPGAAQAWPACDCCNTTCVWTCAWQGSDKRSGRIVLLEKLACNVWGRVILQRDTVSISSTRLILSWSQEGQMLPNLLLSQVLP